MLLHIGSSPLSKRVSWGRSNKEEDLSNKNKSKRERERLIEAYDALKLQWNAESAFY